MRCSFHRCALGIVHVRSQGTHRTSVDNNENKARKCEKGTLNFGRTTPDKPLDPSGDKCFSGQLTIENV